MPRNEGEIKMKKVLKYYDKRDYETELTNSNSYYYFYTSLCYFFATIGLVHAANTNFSNKFNNLIYHEG
ncbi:MAG: conserved hypothetical protein [Methanobrevibacter sp. CfCl-M3]